ncbi:hypothetical protein SAMN05216311_11664 [Chitinophaga sp. CF418]|nr:hypothetical protein SAMN05216311_11664 [Chitinophaga sp. CF418]
MGNKSFYDLDYIIEINEQRLEQYINLHQKSVDRFTTLLMVYSAFCIFLVPIIQTLFFSKEQYHWSYYCSFYLFCTLFIISIVNSIMLLSPEALYILVAPSVYYKRIRQTFETKGISSAQTDVMVKRYYITELEKAIITNRLKLNRKTSFYNRAFRFAIMACIPYLYCIWLQINSEKKVLLKKEIINNLSSFTKTNHICGGKNQNSKKSTITWSKQ